jgi:predicted secreted protein
MTWVSVAALYFILWWLVLFATLPVGLKTQDEDEDVTLGTVSSAPKGPHMLRAFVRTTIVSALILGGFYLLTKGLGLSVDDIPRIVPDFKSDVTSST